MLLQLLARWFAYWGWFNPVVGARESIAARPWSASASPAPRLSLIANRRWYAPALEYG